MHDTRIEQKDGYLGDYATEIGILQVGAVQKMIFSEEDQGPFWMTPAEQEATKHDYPTGETVTRQLRRDEIFARLQAKSIQGIRGKLKDELIAIANAHNVSVSETMENIEEGWLGKPKGLKQILYERGFIDPRNPGKYTMAGSKVDGEINKSTSLLHLMSTCTDFVNEETLLQTMARKMGVTIDRTPKCHPEMAGEGVEYAWGCAKQYYRSQPLLSKRGKKKFRDLVRKSLSPEVLTVDKIRKFSRRARRYICAYYELSHPEASLEIKFEAIAPEIIERLVKKYKTHRSAVDFDGGFIATVVKQEKNCEQEKNRKCSE
jgi:hypothetical protein